MGEETGFVTFFALAPNALVATAMCFGRKLAVRLCSLELMSAPLISYLRIKSESTVLSGKTSVTLCIPKRYNEAYQ